MTDPIKEAFSATRLISESPNAHGPFEFAPTIEAAGFRSFPAGPDWVEWQPEATFPELWRDFEEERGFWLLTEIFAWEAPRRMTSDLLELSGSWKPDLVVRNDFNREAE